MSNLYKYLNQVSYPLALAIMTSIPYGVWIDW